MPRIKARIAYDGTDFLGWQTQPQGPTIQSTLEKALEQICGERVSVTGAGRTDSGVHAFGQIAHFNWSHSLTTDRLILAINAIVPFSIRVLELEEVHNAFHARFDARSKIYLYRIDRNRNFDPFHFRYALHYYSPLNFELIEQCMARLVGKQDFKAFQATGSDVVSTQRTMIHAQATSDASISSFSAHQNFLYFRFQADGFLRKMVRFLTGTILEIASGRRPLEDLGNALDTGDRQYVGVPAAARGLFLEQVIY
jgi:tRNA pseudouridine38-40 synthase